MILVDNGADVNYKSKVDSETVHVSSKCILTILIINV